MTTNAIILESARNFVDWFGKDAPVEARQHADKLQQAGNTEAHDTWMQISKQAKCLVEDGIEAPED